MLKNWNLKTVLWFRFLPTAEKRLQIAYRDIPRIPRIQKFLLEIPDPTYAVFIFKNILSFHQSNLWTWRPVDPIARNSACRVTDHCVKVCFLPAHSTTTRRKSGAHSGRFLLTHFGQSGSECRASSRGQCQGGTGADK